MTRPSTRRNLVVTAPGVVELVEEPLAPLGEGQVLLETVATGLSAGTEITFVRGDNPALSHRVDPELGLFLPADAAEPTYPVTRLGYMEVGRVLDSRTPAFGPGELVAATYGHATHHTASPVLDHLVPLPADLDPLLGTYVAHLGPICANGVLHAALDTTGRPTSLGDGVRGRCVAVTGGGLIGLLTALFCAHHGAREIAVVDEDPRRRDLAESLGFTVATPDDAPVALKTRWRHGPRDHGADVVFQCRGRPRALRTALRVLRPQGTVVDLAFYTDEAKDVRLGEEFHHNGLSIVSAQIGRVPRGMAAWWDRARLSAETIGLLDAHGDAIRTRLITDVVPLSEAPGLMAAVAERERHVLSAVFVPDSPPG